MVLGHRLRVGADLRFILVQVSFYSNVVGI